MKQQFDNHAGLSCDCTRAVLTDLAHSDLFALICLAMMHHAGRTFTTSMDFIMAVALAALARDYRDNKKIKASFLLKLAVVIPGIIAIIIMACLMRRCDDRTPPGASDYITCNGPDSAAASLEWFVTALFCLYILTMVFDMYPSRMTSRHRNTPPMALVPPTHTAPGKKGFFSKGKGQGQEPHGTMTNGAGMPAAGVPNGYNAQPVIPPGSSMV